MAPRRLSQAPMFAPHAYVTVHGLQSRAELNGRTGRVLVGGAKDDGRIPIRVLDERNAVLCNCRVRSANLVEKDTAFLNGVLDDREILDLILTSLWRWERAGRASGVSHLWRRSALESQQLWKNVVLVPTSYSKPSAKSLQNKLKRLGTISSENAIHRHVHSDYLPLWAVELSPARWPLERRIRCLSHESHDETWDDPEPGEEADQEACDEYYGVRDSWPDPALWIEKLVIPGALGYPVDYDESDPVWSGVADTCVDARALATALGAPQMQPRSVSIDFGDWKDRIFPTGPRSSPCGPAFRPNGPVDRWLQSPPSVLENVHVLGLGRAHTRWWRFDPPSLPNLKSLSPFSYTPEEVAGWPAETRARLECVSLSIDAAYEVPSFCRMLELLPALRRVKWTCGGFDTADFQDAILAVKRHGTLSSLYIQCDSATISDFSGLRALKDQLIEFAFASDTCELSHMPLEHDNAWAAGISAVFKHSPDWARELTEVLSRLLPRTNVRVWDVCSVSDRVNETDVLHRHFLPHVLEPWQAEAVGPLHNTTDVDARAKLEGDVRTEALLQEATREMREMTLTQRTAAGGR